MTLAPCIGFDLGDTLLEYAGIPLNWESHYAEALDRLAQVARVAPTAVQRVAAVDVLRTYNTRLRPRTTEVAFATIAAEILGTWGRHEPLDEAVAATAFFGVFQQRLQPFADAVPTLTALRAEGHRIGIFTDVAYGMPRALVERDVAAAGLTPHVDVLVTSRDVGHRKPSALALAGLARALDCSPEQMIYVGNEAKDIAAAQAFGCHGILIDRAGAGPDWGQGRTIRSLLELRA